MSLLPRPDPLPAGEGQESVWDYPRPPRLEPVPRPLRVEVGGQIVADTRAGLRVLETASPPTYYIPPQDIRMDLLVQGRGTSWCEWKGRALYWDFAHAEQTVRHLAWSYPDPYDEYQALRGYLAFFVHCTDACWVGHERATPQPGGFYGGWVTSQVAGPFKGEPGSEGW